MTLTASAARNEWLEQFRRLEFQKSEALGLLDDKASLEYKPKPDSWNKLEVIQHLVLAEQGFLRQAASPGVHWKTKVPVPIGKLVVWIVFTFGFRVKSPAKSTLPFETLTYEEVADRWNAVREQLRVFLESGEAKKAYPFFHPLSGRMSTMKLLRFLEIHTGHHIKQIRRIEQSRIGSPT